MLIKSECQPLDETRHKPAWNLFEQRESCKMAGEICSAARPPNQPAPLHVSPYPSTHLHRPVTFTPLNMSTETDRHADRQHPQRTGVFCSPLLQRDIRPADTQGKQRGCNGTAALPFTHRWLTPPSNLLDNDGAGGRTYIRVGITGPVIT